MATSKSPSSAWPKFSSGWRSQNGVQWEAFPANVADGKTKRELALLNKVAAGKGITGKDDPTLLKLGEVLVPFHPGPGCYPLTKGSAGQ